MRLRERFASDEGSGRGNVMLAAAMMLAVLVVLVALGLTLAPTGSDGVTDESADDSEFDVVDSGLQQAVFVESNDTLDPAYDPAFRPPDSDRPAPINNGTIAELLAPEPFTDEQVVQIQSLLTSLGYRSMGGDIAALEPVANETETGVLVRLGNLEPRDLGDTTEPLVENATAVQDVELVLERTTLPTAPENATTAHVGDWTLAAYQNASTDRVQYQLGSYDPDAPWHHTAQEENLHVSVHEATVNGAPVPGGLGFDPGEPPVEVRVVDTNRSNGVASTHGGLNVVAVGAGSDDVHTDALSAETDWQEVVTRPVFNTTYLDATTTLDSRLAVDAEYRYFEYDHDSTEPFLMDVSLAVETEDPASLDGPLPAGRLWLPAYSMEPINYTIDVVGTYSNGTEVDLSDQANVTIYNRTADGVEPCANGDGCVDLEDLSESVIEFNYIAVPHTLTDVQIRAELPGVAGAPDTLRRNVSIVDPYTDTELAVANNSVAVGNGVGTVTMELTPRKQGLPTRTVPRANISELDSLPARHAANALAHPLGLADDPSKDPVVDALAKLREFDAAERTAFLAASPSQQAEMLGAGWTVEGLLEFFDSLSTCGTCPNYTTAQAVAGPPQDTAGPTSHGPPSQLGLLYRGAPSIDIETFQQLAAIKDVRQRDGKGIPEHKLYELGTTGHELTDEALADTLTAAMGWDNTTARAETATLVFQYIELFGEEVDGPLYKADEDQLQDAAYYVGVEIEDDGRDLPSSFEDLSAELLTEFATSHETPPFYSYHNYQLQLNDDQRLVYFWLGGIDDSQTRQDLRAMVEFGDETEPAVTRSTELLFDVVDFTLLDQQALDEGSVELAELDELRAAWEVTMDGTYTEYSFANYSATDTVAVTDPAANIVDINVTLETTDVGPLLQEVNASLYTDEVLRVNRTANITTTVTYRSGAQQTNPPFVEYDLVGPAFEPGPCPGGAECTAYSGPTTPEGFATVDEVGHDLTPKRETGLTQAWTDGIDFDDWAFNETGPLVLAASVNGTSVSDTVSTTAVEIGVSGDVAFPFGSDMKVLEDASGGVETRAPTEFEAEYLLQHIAHDSPSAFHSYASAPWSDTHEELVATDVITDHEVTPLIDEGAPAFPELLTVTVEAEDSTGATVTASRPVRIQNGGYHAAFTADTFQPQTGESVTFNASDSRMQLPVENNPEYTWSFGDGTEEIVYDSPEVSHTYDDAGTYTVSVTIKTPESDTYIYNTYRTVVVTETESDLSVALTADPDKASHGLNTPPEPVTFTAGEPQGDIVNYTWSFGDGTNVTTTEPTINHTYWEGPDPVGFTAEYDNPTWDSYGGLEVTTEDRPLPYGSASFQFNESAALDLPGVADTLTATGGYSVEDNGSGDPGGGGPEPPVGPFSILGSNQPSGTIVGDVPLTTLMNEQNELTETVNPDVERGHYSELYPSAPEFFRIEGKENETTDYYLWSNAGALDATRGDEQSLIAGQVPWRNKTGCGQLDSGCLDKPSGIADHIDTPTDDWASKILGSTSNGPSVGVFSPDQYGPGRHTHSIAFNVSGENPPDTVEGQLTFKGERDGFGKDTVTVDFAVESSDGGDDPK